MQIGTRTILDQFPPSNQMLKYIKHKWLFLLIVLILLLLNIWVWFIYEAGMDIKRAGDFVETKKMVLIK